jgi:PAS domain S-box-containing protein
MADKNDTGLGKSAAFQTLYKRAEEILSAADKAIKDGSASEMSKLIHELKIYQVELEMQNEELRKSQSETERSRKAYQDLWELSPVGHLIVDFAGRVIAVNRAVQRLFGRPENALLNERFSTLVAPESRVPVRLMFERAVVAGLAERQEIRILKPGDAIHICLMEVSSLGGEPGREQMQAVLTDITDHKRAEEAVREAADKLEMKVEKRAAELVAANKKLRQEIKVRNEAEKELQASEMLLSTTFAALQDLLIVIDKDFRVLISNWKGHDYISENKRQGHPYCYEVFLNRKKPCNPCHAMKVFATGEANQFEDTNPIDGKIRDIRMIPMFDDEGKVAAIVEHLRDITDQKQANEQIRSLSQQLIKAQEDERQMISRELHDRVAQDLSTLLIGLNTISDHLPNVIPEVQKKALELSEIVQGTINVVRDLSYELRLPGLDGIGLIPALSMYCEEFAEKHGLKVDFQSLGLKDLRLDFETEMNLYRLIQEGLNNIHKHAAASLATVKIVGTYPNIIMRIEDNGQGFDVEKRARTAYSEKRMGLRSMTERVRLIQGEMTIQSQPMKGTRILIKFPYQEEKHDSKKNDNDRR